MSLQYLCMHLLMFFSVACNMCLNVMALSVWLMCSLCRCIIMCMCVCVIVCVSAWVRLVLWVGWPVWTLAYFQNSLILITFTPWSIRGSRPFTYMLSFRAVWAIQMCSHFICYFLLRFYISVLMKIKWFSFLLNCYTCYTYMYLIDKLMKARIHFHKHVEENVCNLGISEPWW